MLARLRDAALAGENLFAVLMDAVRVCSLGQITDALFEVGGPLPPQRLTDVRAVARADRVSRRRCGP